MIVLNHKLIVAIFTFKVFNRTAVKKEIRCFGRKNGCLMKAMLATG